MISIQTDDFDPSAEYASLRDSGSGTGAIATFTGLVRDHGDQQGVTGLYLEHYPGMTEQVIAGLIDEASKRWDVRKARVIHRVGQLSLNDQIVFVGVCSAHRSGAFAACEYIMDALKTSAPFWKKELAESGEHWVEQKETDLARTKTWK
ncbi:molybdenum cofactor biosynthesis protein MoaE [Marinobacter sp. chi1]|uniref:Molybdopterin synthase catalytic subunit n=1 Tax=Marinobacter suaedae TaxID=3057675 RepID=A0ABT8W0B4_9GAMM|nr:molybdenum cofactor biosynthesis protein MoaE [Marinobacter sp. chi1]MDO3721698.1 molybdenum cofactor biosynthesis protein MoaE [Marinobacter sp. chi1]